MVVREPALSLGREGRVHRAYGGQRHGARPGHGCDPDLSDSIWKGAKKQNKKHQQNNTDAYQFKKNIPGRTTD